MWRAHYPKADATVKNYLPERNPEFLVPKCHRWTCRSLGNQQIARKNKHPADFGGAFIATNENDRG